MKKFSTITGQKVGQEPAKEKRINERDELKSRIMQLIDNYLSVQTYGPIDRYQRAGTIKIMGKEVLAEALMSVLGENSLKEQTKLLESLKSGIRDWELIDEKIEEVKAEIEKGKEAVKTAPHVAKLASLYEKYGQDEEMLMEMAQKACEKISKAETARLRSAAALMMSADTRYPKQTFERLSEKFDERHKHLSSTK